VKARKVPGLDSSESLRTNSARIVGTRLEEMRALAERALDPEAVTAQHDMRIAAKRLRYVLEITEDCFGEKAQAAREAAKELQGMLGEIHDCDVTMPLAKGIESLEERLRVRREHAFRQFHGIWQLEASRGTWAALERVL
jgi:CHAD domain-containing protein